MEGRGKYTKVSWATGNGRDGDDPAWTWWKLTPLYDLLEHKVLPMFYRRNEKGIGDWLARMRASMGRLTAKFSANRTSPRTYGEVLLRGAYRLPKARGKLGPTI